MKLTAQDLLDLQVIDAIVPEPAGGAHEDPQTVFQTVDSYLRRALDEMQGMTGAALGAAEQATRSSGPWECMHKGGADDERRQACWHGVGPALAHGDQ